MYAVHLQWHTIMHLHQSARPRLHLLLQATHFIEVANMSICKLTVRVGYLCLYFIDMVLDMVL
jgi:hypothetical protein